MDKRWSDKIKTYKMYHCKYCNYTTHDCRNFNKHLKTNKHKNKLPVLICKDNIETTKKYTLHYNNDNIEHIYKHWCNICGYSTNRKDTLERHLKSKKHDENMALYNKQMQLKKNNRCICGKEYKYTSGLSKHKRNCKTLNAQLAAINKKLDELASRPQQIINNTTNNTMNIQAFLNNECGNAQNFIDFIKDIVVSVGDVLRMGNIGFISSYNELVTNKIVNMELRERPTHCTNKQKLNFYVKHNDTWLQDKENEIMKRSIHMLKDKEVRVLCKHTEETLNKEETNREVNERVSALGEIQKMGDTKKIEKILRETAKQIHMNRETMSVICND